MSDSTQSFLTMAHHDLRLFEIKKSLAQIPGKIDSARSELDAQQTLLDSLQNPWDALQAEIDEKEATIKVALETIEKFEQHMERVNTQKEYMAARKQVDDARKLNQKLQDEILERRMKQEEIDPELNEVRERHATIKSGFAEQEDTLTKEKVSLEAAAKAEEKAIQDLSAQVDGRVWGHYQRLLNSGRTPVIVPASNGSCGGCKMTIPPQSFNLILADPSGFHTCSHCSRILYVERQPKEEEGGEVEQPKVASGG